MDRLLVVWWTVSERGSGRRKPLCFHRGSTEQQLVGEVEGNGMPLARKRDILYRFSPVGVTDIPPRRDVELARNIHPRSYIHTSVPMLNHTEVRKTDNDVSWLRRATTGMCNFPVATDNPAHSAAVLAIAGYQILDVYTHSLLTAVSVMVATHCRLVQHQPQTLRFFINTDGGPDHHR